MDHDLAPVAPEQKFHTKAFRFRFSPLILTVLGLVLALCAACFALTTYRFISFVQGDVSSVYDWLQYILLYFVSVFFALLVVAMLVKSQYVLTDKELITQFGIVKSKYALKTVYSVRHFKGSDRLTVYFDDFKTKYIVIVVKREWYEEFVKELLARNERIEFDYVTAEEEQSRKNGRKK